MATVEELLAAALRADKAGDEQAAAKLVAAARSMQPGLGQKPTYREQTQEGPYTLPRANENEGPNVAKPDRFGDTIAKMTEGPMAATKAFGAGLADQSKSPTMAALPDWVPSSVKPTVAGLGDLGGAALGALGTGYAFGAGLIGETFGGSPSDEKRLAKDLMVAGQVAVPELAGVSGAAMATNKAARAAAALERPATARQATARAAGNLGITPSLAMTGKTGAMVSAGMEKLPLSASIIAKDAARVVGEVESAFTKSVQKIGTASGPMGAGDRMQSGLGVYVNSFKGKSDKLYSRVDAAMPKSTPVAIDNTARTIAESKQFFASNPELAAKLGLNQWDTVIAEAQKNGVNWQAVKQLRSKIGEAIGSNRGALADEDIGRLKGLYGALTADMEVAAKQAGPEAYKAWRVANSHYKAGAERIEKYLDKSISAQSPERAFEAFVGMTKGDRASSDVTRMREIKASLPEEDWKVVSSSIVDRLGKAPAGQQGAAGDVFSPSTFLTQWNGMSKEAKALLVPQEVRGELDSLARVAESVKAANSERNFSNTGTTSGWLAVVFGSAADMGTTATALGANALSAKALTSQTFLQAMNRAARGDAKQMAILARGNNAFSQDAKVILQLMAADAANTPAPPARMAN